MDSSTDMAILHLDVPAQQQGILDALQMRLRALPGMYEVAVGRLCTCIAEKNRARAY